MLDSVRRVDGGKAVVAATAAHYALGGLWFSAPVFGRRWARAIGFTPPEGYRPGVAAYLGPLAGSLLGSTATAALARATGARTPREGAALGLLVGLGYGVGMPATFAVAPQVRRPAQLAAISGAYQLLGFALVGAIVRART